MSGNYGYSNYNFNRPPDPQSRQPPPGAPQTPQYAHGHQTYAAHGYQNAPPQPYMNYAQYPPQPYSQQPTYSNEPRRIDYSPYQQPQPPPPNQPPRPAPSLPDQYPPTTAPAMYNPWMNERSSPQPARVFDEEAERKYAIDVFKRFDQDAGGYLDLQEFMDALRALHLAISYHEALDRFGRYDVNEDGRISQEEFVRIYVNERRIRFSAASYQQPSISHPPPAPMRP